MPEKVAVLGSTGMLGSMVVHTLKQDAGLLVEEFSRDRGKPGLFFDALYHKFNPTMLFDTRWVINCIGLTKPMIQETDPASVRRAIHVNSVFPHMLADLAETRGFRVLQIATDCVYSGSTGRYTESSDHDALDVYGKTKSLGEVRSDRVFHLRCSIIGPEPPGRNKFLVEWLRNQPEGAEVPGYVNHVWNGVTTLQFAKICAGIIREDLPGGHTRHVVPSGEITKCDLLRAICRSYGRRDIRVLDAEASYSVDRTLATNYERDNGVLWGAAGYQTPPTVEEMVEEVSKAGL